MAIAPGIGRREGAVLGLVGSGHFFSHFYMLALPPLFPVLKAEFGIGYTALGGLVTAFSLASGAAQYPMGTLVDRFGARWLLIAGLATLSAGIGLMALAPSYVALLCLAFVAGLGNSVFHPADYTVLGAAIRQDFLGRAFAVHTFSGHVGWAAAPLVMTLLATQLGWRGAVAVAAAAGLSVAAAMVLGRGRLVGGGAEGHAAGQRPAAKGAGLALLVSPPIMMMFVFFVMIAALQVGVQSFTTTALVDAFATPLSEANAALTAFLVASAGGVLLGGVAADRLRRFDLIATVCYLSAAAALCVVASAAMPVVLLALILGFAGLMNGMIAPSRDLMVRAIAPPGTTGKVFGFVSTGLDVGGAAAPLAFGWLLDHGAPTAVFLLAAGMMVVAVVAALSATRIHARTAQPAAAE